MVNLLTVFRTSHDPTVAPPPKEVVNSRVILLGLYGSFCAILFGYDLGFIGGVLVLPSFVKDYDLATASAASRTAFNSNVVSVFQAGAVFGAMLSSISSNLIGRKMTLLANLVVYLLGAVLMTAASGTAGVGLVYAGRVLTGWGVGASTMLVPIFVAESSPAHIRGRLVGLYEVGVQFGTMVSRNSLDISLIRADRLLDPLRRVEDADWNTSMANSICHPDHHRRCEFRLVIRGASLLNSLSGRLDLARFPLRDPSIRGGETRRK